jgi:hypothetical protein
MAIRNDFAPGEVLAAADLNDTFGSKLDLAGGKILQIVRNTDATQRTTTSTSFVDVTGMSVTITPQKNTSAVLLICIVLTTKNTSNEYVRVAITDSSNNAISGAESGFVGTQNADIHYGVQTLFGYSTPATTSATTYKVRFRSNSGGTVDIRNDLMTGQLYAIEVSA